MIGFGFKKKRHEKRLQNLIKTTENMLDEHEKIVKAPELEGKQISTDIIIYGLVYRLIEQSNRLNNLTIVLMALTAALICLTIKAF